jgi:hypothetical protein
MNASKPVIVTESSKGVWIGDKRLVSYVGVGRSVPGTGGWMRTWHDYAVAEDTKRGTFGLYEWLPMAGAYRQLSTCQPCATREECEAYAGLMIYVAG